MKRLGACVWCILWLPGAVVSLCSMRLNEPAWRGQRPRLRGDVKAFMSRHQEGLHSYEIQMGFCHRWLCTTFTHRAGVKPSTPSATSRLIRKSWNQIRDYLWKVYFFPRFSWVKRIPMVCRGYRRISDESWWNVVFVWKYLNPASTFLSINTLLERRKVSINTIMFGIYNINYNSSLFTFVALICRAQTSTKTQQFP